MAWIMLIIAALLEVVWAFSLKQSHGFTRLTPLEPGPKRVEWPGLG